MMYTVREARPAEFPTLAALLARSFFHDPVYRWLFPNEKQRLAKMQRLFAIFLQDAMRKGMVLTTEGREGAALWISPEKARGMWLRELGQSLRILYIIGPGVLKGAKYYVLVESKHPSFPHWYLLLLGVDPEAQGKGVGSALLQAALDRPEVSRFPVYLDTAKEEVVPFYEKHGFKVTNRIRVNTDLTIFQMLREPNV